MEVNVEKTKVMRLSRQPSLLQIMIDQKQLENVECFNNLGSKIPNDARCTCAFKSRTAMVKGILQEGRLFFIRKLDLNLRNKVVKSYIWSVALYGDDTWTVRRTDQMYLVSSEMWWWRGMEISWTDHVTNEEILHRLREKRNILHRMKRGKAN